MTKVVILQDESLEEYYQRTRDYLEAKYHAYPTNPGAALTGDEDYPNEAEGLEIPEGVPLGKLVL